MTGKERASETRQRLLEAAGEVFAERGFRGATTREICKRAKANVAALHYHFGNKEKLYRAVFDYARKDAPRLDQPAFCAGSAEEQLRAYIHTMLARFFDEDNGGRPALFEKLIAHEMINPTKVLDLLAKQHFRPNAVRMRAIVHELIGREVDDDTVRRCMFSIAAQWLFYFHCGQAVKRIDPDQRFGPQEIQQLADHITKFSITALKGWQT